MIEVAQKFQELLVGREAPIGVQPETLRRGPADHAVDRRDLAEIALEGALAEPISPHGLRAGFVTTAYRNGVPDDEIMGSYAPSKPDHHAQLCTAGQAQPDESGREAWALTLCNLSGATGPHGL